MMTWIDVVNFGIVSGGIVLTVLGLLLSLSSRELDARSRRFFVVLFGTCTLYILLEFVTTTSLLFAEPAYAGMTRVTMFLTSSISPFLLIIIICHALTCAGRKIARSPAFWINVVLILLYLAELIAAQGRDFFYQISDNNIYSRGPYYFILLIVPAIQILVNLAAVIYDAKRLSRLELKGFLECLILPMVCMLVQMFLYGIVLVLLGSAVSCMLMYSLILEEQKENSLRLIEENNRQKMNILLLQIRPHFIYNTMSSIYYLCEIDPAKAQQVVGDFTTYLRKNYSALSKEGLISFEEELEHTRAYLSVEKVRYDKLLFVEYEIGYTAFQLPPLTLQPLVENAVKHGLDPEFPSLHLRIQTKKTADAVEILVEDDGPGFADYYNDSEHIGLNNVKKRLEYMCHATLETIPKEKRGTIVRIRVPHEVR